MQFLANHTQTVWLYTSQEFNPAPETMPYSRKKSFSKSTPFAGATHPKTNTTSAKWTPAKKKSYWNPHFKIFYGYNNGFVFGLPLLKNHRVQGTCNAYTVASNTYPDFLPSDLFVPGSTQTPRDLNWLKKTWTKRQVESGRKICFFVFSVGEVLTKHKKIKVYMI